MKDTFEFTVRLTVEDPAALQREIEQHNERVESGRTSGIIEDDPAEWDWSQLMIVWENEMAGEDAFDLIDGREVAGR